MIEIPSEVIEAISECRKSGGCNMFDRNGVIAWCSRNGYVFEAVWLHENKNQYGQVLTEFGKMLKD